MVKARANENLDDESAKQLDETMKILNSDEFPESLQLDENRSDESDKKVVQKSGPNSNENASNENPKNGTPAADIGKQFIFFRLFEQKTNFIKN